ncbi:MAG: hypothetical protein DRN24_05155, partial [Thermoplasmata archaeon]
YDYVRDQAGEKVVCRRITSYNFFEDEVTWNKATSTQNWNSPGLYPDDVSDPVDNDTYIPSSFGWVSWDVTDAVRGWINGTYNNYGLYLAFYKENDLLSHATYFYSCDYTGDTSKRPKLEVIYCTPPTVTNDGGATNVEETTATLRGEVTDTGGEAPTVTIYYGDNDGGTSPGNWDHSVNMGAQSSTFSKYVTGLTSGDLYYYRCYASNPAGDDWADSSEKFFTKPECPDSISVTGSTTTSISFSINKADMGPGATSYTYARYSTTGYPTTRTSGTFAFNTTSTTVTKTGLNPGTKYYFSAWAWGEEGGVGQYSDTYITTYGYTKPGDPSNLDANNPTATTIDLSWTKGSGSGNERTVIRYRTDTYPSSPTDGTEAYNGTGSATTVSGLTPGQIYYFRAWTYDPDSGYFSSGYSSDSEYTLPADITNFDAKEPTPTSINISWTKGSGGDKTVIRRSTSGYPASPTDGVEVYNGTGTWYNDTGLAPNTVYYYSAWAYDSDSGYFSANPAQDTETTLVGSPSVITNAATNVEETSATLNAYISNTGGENPYRYIEWGLYGQAFTHNESLGIGGVGAYHKDVTGLSKGTRYHFRGLANNSRGWGYGSTLTFRTKPDPPTGFSATAINKTTINLSWNKGEGAWHTVIIRKAGSMPNNRSDGIEIYNGTGTSYSDTGLNAFTTYYYRAWSITDTPDRQFSDPPDATASATTWSPKTILAKGDAYQLVINGTTLYGYINGVPLVSTTIDTNWHHVAFTYDGSTAKLYLDGELKDINTSYSQTIKTNDENLLIGKNFQGTLDEVRLWSRALTWEEINASYNAKAIGSYYHNFTDLTYGNYTYYAYAIDTAGNENTTETRYYNCTSGGNQPPQNGIPILNNFDDIDNAYAKKKWYNITVTYSDPNGYSDLKYMRMEFKQGTITRAVFNYTEATDTFTQEDGLNKFQLDTTGSIAIKSGNNITVHWHFKPLWGADEEADVDIQCYCVDDSGLSDSDIYNDQFDVVTNLLTATIECNDTNDPDRVSINENIRINFSIRYANDPGSNTPSTSYPPDDEFNSVSVINSSGIIMATDTTITNGNGSVTFNAPATVGSDNYTLYIDMADSDYNDGEETNLKEWIITDRVNITSITVTNYSYYDGSRYWDGNSPITITYTAILDYDGTSFDGEVNAGYFGNTTAWGTTTNLAVAPNDYSSGLIITRDGVTAGSVANGGTYGITAITVSASKPDVGWDGIRPTCSIEYNSSATYFKAGEKLRIYANFSTGGGTGINESTVKIAITTQGDGDLAQTAMIKTDNTHWYYDWIIPSGSDEDGNFTVSITAKDNVSNPLNPDPTNDTSKYIDNSPPNTSVDAISPYRVTSKPKTITVTANDNLSGLYNVSLWYRFSNDNQSWGGWTIVGTKNSSPWQWSFDFPNGTGYYEFYSIGVDNVGNVESAPSTADAECYYNPNNPPIINSIDLRNDTGSKLDSDQMIDVNKEYYFL